MIYFTSDPHYNHKNICKGLSEWDNKLLCRPFNNLADMNLAIVQAINSVVKPNDTLYCLGDWSFGNIDSALEFRMRLACKNIHLIYGNHDQDIIANRYVKEDKDRVESNPYVTCGVWLPRSLFASADYYKSISVVVGTRPGKKPGTTKALKKQINMFHYACRIWDRAHHDTIMLYGHSHGTLNDGLDESKMMTMDVGMDARFMKEGHYTPYSLDEVMAVMKERENGFVMRDHHSPTTN